MLNFNKIIEILLSLQIIIVSSFIPAFILIPSKNQIIQTFDIPISWQVPSIILLTLIYEGKVVTFAFSIYLLTGLFFLPVFQDGGSTGYLLTQNFGYLLGTYALINIIDKLNRMHKKIYIYELIKYGILGISSMHIIGICYGFVQTLFFKQPDLLLYNFSKYSLGKFIYHLLMISPLTLLIKPINNNYRYNK